MHDIKCMTSRLSPGKRVRACMGLLPDFPQSPTWDVLFIYHHEIHRFVHKDNDENLQNTYYDLYMYLLPSVILENAFTHQNP